MIDCKGRELNINDRVLFTVDNHIREGVLSKMYPIQCDVEIDDWTYKWLNGSNVPTKVPYKTSIRIRYPIYQLYKLGE